MPDLRTLCHGLQLRGDTVLLSFDGDETARGHAVRITETPDNYEFETSVASAAHLPDPNQAALQLWLRNHSSRLVTFRLSPRQRITAHAWLPKPALTSVEFQLVLSHLAAASDRMEFLLTGQDRE
jgi:hypothetical protein